MSTLTKVNEALDTTGIAAITKAQVLLEALPYIQRFRDSIFVVKYGGSFMDDPDPVLRQRVATDLVFLASVSVKVVVVHGGGKAISRAMREAGIEPEFRNGLRYTDETSVRLVERTLNQEVNPEICEMVSAQGGNPLSMPGNGVLKCETVTHDLQGNPIDLGYVGDIQHVITKLIRKALREDKTPVISPIALDDEDRPHNTNADVAAGAVASALRARRLVYLCDVPGLLRDPNDPESLISTLRVDEIDGLIRDGVISAGMLPKVESARRAIAAGVHRVHFVDGRMPHSILLEIFTHRGIGTEIVAD